MRVITGIKQTAHYNLCDSGWRYPNQFAVNPWESTFKYLVIEMIMFTINPRADFFSISVQSSMHSSISQLEMVGIDTDNTQVDCGVSTLVSWIRRAH